ncbi:MAG TPA: hypothetical protein VK446_00480 [Methylocystis sp.]|nr:hypothetical protein [Methylocystis sp.]
MQSLSKWKGLILAALCAGLTLAPARAKDYTPKLINLVNACPAANPNCLSFPVAAVVNSLNNRVYVADYFAQQLIVIDGTTNQVVNNIPIPQCSQNYTSANGPGGAPANVVFNSKSNLYYVFMTNGCYWVADGNTDQLLTSVQITSAPASSGYFGPGPYTAEAALNNKTGKLYVTNYLEALYIFDGNTGTLLNKIVDLDANDMTLDEKTNLVYLSQYYEGSVFVIDGDTNELVNILSNVVPATGPAGCWLVDGGYNCTAQGPDLDKLTINPANPEQAFAQTVYGPTWVVNARTGATISLLPELAGTDGSTAINPNNNLYYFAYAYGGVLQIIDVASLKVVLDQMPIGPAPSPPACFFNCLPYPNGLLVGALAVNPHNGKIYAGTQGAAGFPAQVWIYQQP